MQIILVLLLFVLLLVFGIFMPIMFVVGMIKPALLNRPDNPPMSRKKILGVTFVAEVLLFLGIIVIYSMLPKENTAAKATNTQQAQGVKQSPQVPYTTATASPSEKPIEKMNIVVDNLIVKKIDGKYRYFFEVHNHDTKPFEGKITIFLYQKDKKDYLIGNSFETSQPMVPEGGTSVYFDTLTGTESQYGEYGVHSFEYNVFTKEGLVNSGTADITDKFEDFDAEKKEYGL